MMKSGTHDNDTFNFVEVAMWEFHGFTPISVYYFYTRCKEHMDIDCIFQLTMDESLKGNSISVRNEGNNSPPSSVESKLTQSMEGDTTLSTIMKQGQAMVDLLQSSIEDQKKDTDERKQHNKLITRIEAAKAVRDMDELKHLHLELNKKEEHNTE